jgi:hypothetical protein
MTAPRRNCLDFPKWWERERRAAVNYFCGSFGLIDMGGLQPMVSE